jgi:Uma2 family endonuclease
VLNLPAGTVVVSAEEYLALDRAAEFRSEFIDGEIIERPGASIRHARLQVILACEIQAALRDSPCQAFSSNLRLRVSPRMYTYPDLTVVCGEPVVADKRQDILLNPTVIFEVVSPSTAYYDWGVKFRRYRQIESLTDYILVDQDQTRIEQFTRGDANTWTLRDYQRPDETLLIPSIGVSLPLAAIYEGIEFPSE